MNLDITTRHLKCTSKKHFQDNKCKEKFQENCYNCNQQEHIAKNCWKLKKQAVAAIKILRKW